MCFYHSLQLIMKGKHHHIRTVITTNTALCYVKTGLKTDLLEISGLPAKPLK